MSLTNDEKEQLRDVDTWDELDTAVESIVAFRGREAARLALMDAAGDLERDPKYHDTTGIITEWLRDRARLLAGDDERG